MRDMNYNKESFKSSIVGLPKEELVLLHSSIRVAMAKTPREKLRTMRYCEQLRTVVFGNGVIERLEGMGRKELLSMLNVTNGILMKKSYSETGRINW
jgi:hypothetical protein